MNPLLIIAILLFIGLVVVHELGHFIAARRGGVEVEEFGIGFPPRAWSRRLKSGLLLSLNWLPIGGFVRLKGENDADKRKGSFGAAKLSTKVKIMLAGVTMNLVTAFVILTALALLGMPRLIDNQYSFSKDSKVVRNDVLLGYVEPDSPAEKAGFKPNDQLVKVSGQTVETAEQLPNITKQFAGQNTQVEIRRDQKLIVTDVTLRTSQEVEASRNTNDPKGYLGISPTEYTLVRSTWSAPIVAGGLIKQFTELTLKGIGRALWQLVSGNAGEAGKQVAGPVGIFVLLSDGSSIGYEFILMIIAIISLTLAIMNILPIPALDGGRLFVTLLFKAIKKPLTKSREEWIHGTGFALLMMLFLLITVVDIRRNF
jgi:regulator of sigma E protease